MAALQDFASQRRQHYGKDVALGVPAEIGGSVTGAVTDGNSRSSWTSADGADQTPIVVEPRAARRRSAGSAWAEDTLAHGQQIRGFKVEYLSGAEWVQAASASTVGVEPDTAVGLAGQRTAVAADGHLRPRGLRHRQLGAVSAAGWTRANSRGDLDDCEAATARAREPRRHRSTP